MENVFSFVAAHDFEQIQWICEICVGKKNVFYKKSPLKRSRRVPVTEQI